MRMKNKINMCYLTLALCHAAELTLNVVSDNNTRKNTGETEKY